MRGSEDFQGQIIKTAFLIPIMLTLSVFQPLTAGLLITNRSAELWPITVPRLPCSIMKSR